MLATTLSWLPNGQSRKQSPTVVVDIPYPRIALMPGDLTHMIGMTAMVAYWDGSSYHHSPSYLCLIRVKNLKMGFTEQII